MPSVGKKPEKQGGPNPSGPKPNSIEQNYAPILDLDTASNGTSTTRYYHVGDPLTKIAPCASVVDGDSPDFQGGSLRVALTGNWAEGDQLAIITDATVTLTGNDNSGNRGVKINGTLVGTLSGGQNGTDLVISLHSTATPAQVEILLEHVGYSSSNTSTLTRTVTFTLIDGDGVANGGSDTASATATITYGPQEPTNIAPVLTGDRSADMAEGSGYRLTSADLSFSDPDDGAAGVTFTISNCVNGTVKVNGVAATSFTGQQLLDGLVTFEHDGSETGAATFDVSVEDGNEDSSTPTASRFTFTVSAVNDAPVLTGDMSAAVMEGGSSTLTAADLGFSDPDDEASGVTFTVSNLSSGVVKVNGVAATSFTGQQLQSGMVSFTHDGSETTTASFDVAVEDGNEDGSAPLASTFNLTVSSVNDAPVITGDLMATVNEGGSYTLTAADLGFSDPDDSASGVMFTVSNQMNGTVKVNGVAATSFTGQQLQSGMVSFTHDGSETTAASFNVVVEDGNEDGSAPTPSTFTFTVNPMNDAPVIAGDLMAMVDEGGSYTLTAADLGFNDPDDNASDVTFTVSNPSNGMVKVNGVAATSFTGQQLQSGMVSFTHDGSETTAASFNVVVEDGNEDGSAPTPSTFNFTVSPVNDAPVMTGDLAAAVNEGGSHTLTAADLGFNDPDDNASGVTFTISNQLNGTVKVNGIAATSFTGQQLQSGVVSFTHDGSETTAASFNVVVEDGNEDGSAPTSGTFNFTVNPVNDAPVMTGDLAATVDEGSSYTLTAADLGFNDPDDNASGVTFTVSNQLNGMVKVNGIAATSFTGQQLQSGMVSFTHDGSETITASFNVAVEDGNEDGSTPTPSTFNFTVNPVNDAPVITGDLAAIVDEGSSYTLTAADLGFNDPDNIASSVTFTVSNPSNGLVKVNGVAATSFTGQQLLSGMVSFAHDGSETVSASFNVAVEDGNEDGSSPTPSTFNFTVNPVNDPPVIGGDMTADIAEGGSYTLTAADLSFSDVDDSASQVTFAVSNQVAGAIEVNGVAATSFTGQQLLDGLVTFHHDGSETLAASFDVVLDDGNEDGSTPSTNTFTFAVSPVNDAPVMTGDLAADIVRAGSYTLKAADLGYTDPDDIASDVTFSVSNQLNGTLKVNNVPATSFTGQQLLDGLVKFTQDGSNGSTASFDVMVEDGNEDGSAPSTSTFNFTVLSANIDLTTLSSTQGFVIVGAAVGDNAGWSVSSAGDVNGDGFDDLLVGAPLGNLGGTDAGQAYLVFGKADGFGTINLAGFTAGDGFIIQGDADADHAGWSVSSAGDINNDGFDDVIVGAKDGNAGGSNAGQAYVLFGKAGGFSFVVDLATLPSSAGFMIQGDAINDLAGYKVSSAGDVNGDGFDDLIVGAPMGDNANGTDAGEAYVVFGKASGFAAIDLTTLSPADGFMIQGDRAGDRAGWSVSAAGDVNGDGLADLIVGAPRGDNGGTDAGEAYVVFGKTTGFGDVLDLRGFSATDGFIIQGDKLVDQAGISVSSAGDVNGDGYDDLIVGSANAGNAYVVFGKGSGFGAMIDLTNLSAANGFIIEGDVVGDQAGWSVAAAGDVNGDGYDDLIVGAPMGDNGGIDAGEAYVLFGKATGFGQAVGVSRVVDLGTLTFPESGFIIQGDVAGDQAGWSVSAAGDINNDGFADLIVGAPMGDDGGSNAGEAYVIFGSSFWLP